jgi:malto-oligosyltrehalose synthase
MVTDASRGLGSTYRLQLHGVGFAGAAAAVPFLADLGVETLYVSPITRARRGSQHGYDVVDPASIDPAHGGRPGLDHLLQTLDAHDMRLLVDIVPNHMAATVENPMFADLLRFGRYSQYAAFFDISWESADNTIVLPWLDTTLPDALDASEIRVSRRTTGDYALRYRDLELPLDPSGNEEIVVELASAQRELDAADRRQLELVVARQHYRLVDWRDAGRLVNYRRFFDINDLIGVRQEDASVFAATHKLVFDLARDPRVAGFRVDHVDGLRDPAAYLASLRAGVNAAAAAWSGQPVIVVEKILGRDEALPRWPVQGTTGYEFAAAVTGLFVDPDGAGRIASTNSAASGDDRSFAHRAIDTKRAVLESLFYSGSGLVLRRFIRAIEPPRPTAPDLSVALDELTTNLAPYRTYRRPGEPLSKADRQVIAQAVAAAGASLTKAQHDALDRIAEVLRGPLQVGSAAWDAVAAWQQLTPAVSAKGVEDTALYAAGTALVGVDVGADPDRPAWSISGLHAFFDDRQATWPAALSAGSTHDSKRSQDVRCRLAVLTEVADKWTDAVTALENILSSAQRAAPDATDRRYAYETVVGAWPIGGAPDGDFRDRIAGHLVKAAREAKRHTSWLHLDSGYERALDDFVDRLLGSSEARDVIEGVVDVTAQAAVTNALAAIVLRVAAPGVPDVYQGEDLWQLALVDPDNRRSVDFGHHRDVLATLAAAATTDQLEKWQDGRIKQAVLRNALHLRRTHREVFARGDYVPLRTIGRCAEHVVAFARRDESRLVVVVVPRLPHTLAGPESFAVGRGVWDDTAIDLSAAGLDLQLTDVLTHTSRSLIDGRLSVADVLVDLPVALLAGELDPVLAGT